MTNDPTVSLPSEADVDGLLKQFRDLREYAARLMFPENAVWAEWLKNDPNSNSRPRKWLVELTSNWLGNLYLFLASLLLSYLSYYIALSASGATFPSGTSQGTEDSSQVLAIVVLLVSLLANVLAYARLLIFVFRDYRYSRIERLLVAVTILTLSVASVVAMAWSTGVIDIRYWVFVLAIAVIPTCTFAFILIVHGAFRIIVSISKFVFFSSPRG